LNALKKACKVTSLLKPSDYTKAAILICLLSLINPVSSASAGTGTSSVLQSELGIALQHFKWTETPITGSRLAEETGMLYGLRQALAHRKQGIGWRQKATFFFGEVDYDGHTWTDIPVQTDVTYIGAAGFFDLEPAYRWPSGVRIKGFAGLGGRVWLRDLAGTQTAGGTRVAGVEELWWTVYGRAGAGVSYSLKRFGRLSAEAGLKLPLIARNEASFHIEGVQTVELEPEQTVSPFAQIAWHWEKVRLGVFYDTLYFDASDSVTTEEYEIYQPESDAETIAIAFSMGFHF